MEEGLLRREELEDDEKGFLTVMNEEDGVVRGESLHRWGRRSKPDLGAGKTLTEGKTLIPLISFMFLIPILLLF